MRQVARVARVGIRKVRAELRGDSETDDGDAGDKDDNRGGHHQGIVVEIPCKGQSTGNAVRTPEGTSSLQSDGECKAEDSSHHRTISKVINGHT